MVAEIHRLRNAYELCEGEPDPEGTNDSVVPSESRVESDPKAPSCFVFHTRLEPESGGTFLRSSCDKDTTPCKNYEKRSVFTRRHHKASRDAPCLHSRINGGFTTTAVAENEHGPSGDDCSHTEVAKKTTVDNGADALPPIIDLHGNVGTTNGLTDGSPEGANPCLTFENADKLSDRSVIHYGGPLSHAGEPRLGR